MWEVGRWEGKVFLNCYHRWVHLGWVGGWGLVNGQIRDTVKFLLFLSGMQSSLYYYVNIITWHSFKVTFPVFLACMYIGLHDVAGKRMLRFVCIAVKIDTYEEYGRRKHRQKVNVFQYHRYWSGITVSACCGNSFIVKQIKTSVITTLLLTRSTSPLFIYSGAWMTQTW